MDFQYSPLTYSLWSHTSLQKRILSAKTTPGNTVFESQTLDKRNKTIVEFKLKVGLDLFVHRNDIRKIPTEFTKA
jgi:hypothetical protein